MSGVVAKIYHGVLKRSSTYAIAVVGAAFFFERGFDMTTEYIYDSINQGKLWKHIKDKVADQ